ncbi:tyrosine-type recombinase/integrase [Amycolatopsis sp. FDAARGOS 1241]|nr:tyrosine-type recombinase/integrase [Amycolatopsis sp. FDAARGOS 1241]
MKPLACSITTRLLNVVCSCSTSTSWRWIVRACNTAGPMFRASINGSGGPLSYDAAHHRWNGYCATAEIDIDIHQLRHAHATELINSGVSIEGVRRRLGRQHRNHPDLHPPRRQSRRRRDPCCSTSARARKLKIAAFALVSGYSVGYSARCPGTPGRVRLARARREVW